MPSSTRMYFSTGNARISMTKKRTSMAPYAPMRCLVIWRSRRVPMTLGGSSLVLSSALSQSTLIALASSKVDERLRINVPAFCQTTLALLVRDLAKRCPSLSPILRIFLAMCTTHRVRANLVATLAALPARTTEMYVVPSSTRTPPSHQIISGRADRVAAKSIQKKKLLRYHFCMQIRTMISMTKMIQQAPYTAKIATSISMGASVAK
mmetsp:Transcript_3789/g.9554  ORF Transcript_3789/g.9554 Transcript_3789/m.9554 type:complete len:208 (-) Transcript_3789:795-1418(-)